MFTMRFDCGWLDMAYIVEKKAKKHFAIYKYSAGHKQFITHRENSKQATKLAKLLAETYYEAYCHGAY